MTVAAGRGLLDGGRKLIEAFESGARSMIGIAIATAAAGIIVGIVTITGLGFGLADIVQLASDGVRSLMAFAGPQVATFASVLVVLFMAQLIALILGMGLPTTANYILMSALIVPIIAKVAGLDTSNPAQMLPVHMFVFYFGIMADSTPRWRWRRSRRPPSAAGTRSRPACRPSSTSCAPRCWRT